MRIVRVITRLDVHGGAELSTLIELEELAARGHELTIATVAEPTTAAAVERLDAAGVGHLHLDGRVAMQGLALRRLVDRIRPDVVHGVIWRAELVTAAASVASSVPTVVSLVNMQYDPAAVATAPSPRRLEALRRVEGTVLRRGIDRFHCLTEAGRRHSVEHLGIPADRITVIPRGRRRSEVVADEDAVAAVRSEQLDGDAHLVVNVGRHESQKGQDLLVQALAERPAAGMRVAIAGREGTRTEALRQQIRDVGLDPWVRLLGARRDVPALLGAADVVAVTSRWEGLGGSIIEALGAGAPIVAFDVPAVREVVGDAGVLVPAFDVAAFGDALRTLVADAGERAVRSERSRRRFSEQFDLDRVVDRIESMYADLGSGR